MPDLPAERDTEDITKRIAGRERDVIETPPSTGDELARSVLAPLPGYRADEASVLSKATFTNLTEEDSGAVLYRFVTGWDAYFAERGGDGSYDITLMQFANPAAAQNYLDTFMGDDSPEWRLLRLRGIPTAVVGKATVPDWEGSFEFDVGARKGDRLMFIDVFSKDIEAAQRNGLLLATPQYALL